MFCKNCGTQLDDDAKFCPHCGARVSGQFVNANTAANADPFSDFPDSTADSSTASIGSAPANGSTADNAGTGNAANSSNTGNTGYNSNNGYYNNNNYNNGYSNGYNGAPNYYQPPQKPQQPYHNPADSHSGGWAFLCFLFPVVGLILYLVWHDTMPLRAHSCGKGAIIGVIVYVVCIIIIYFSTCMLLL